MSFTLSSKFLQKYKHKQPKWGPLGLLVYKRSYSRVLPNGRNENWWQTVQRVVEWCFSTQKKHCTHLNLLWNERKAQASAQKMYELIFNFKFLPPGRGLWAAGSPIVETNAAPLMNCAFCSTKNLYDDFSGPFTWTMTMAMYGVGTGFDTEGAFEKDIFFKTPKIDKSAHVISDSREGWVEAFGRLLDSYCRRDTLPISWDFSEIRAEGEPIKSFGGIAPGPGPLKKLLEKAKVLLEEYLTEDKPVDSTLIVDLMNLAGECVVAGGTRRSSELSLGRSDDNEFSQLKSPENIADPRYARWASNNSISAKIGMDYSPYVNNIAKNGEPGFVWLENARAYSRMGDPKNDKDYQVMGVNPCITGDTLIAVADGRGAVPIKQLAKEGKDVPVYCLDDNQNTVVSWGRNPRLTGTNQSLVSVTLQGKKSFKVTPNHKFILRSGERKEAKDLVCGDALVQFRRERCKMSQSNPTEYIKILLSASNSAKKIWRMEHRLVAEFHQPEKWGSMSGKEEKSGWVKDGIVVHHKDLNSLNNSPENLEIMTCKEHRSLHSQLVDVSGENNPMWGRTHSEETKKKIGRKTLAWHSIPANKERKKKAFTLEKRKEAGKKVSEARRAKQKAYLIEQEKQTNLNTIWKGEELYVIDSCKICSTQIEWKWNTKAKTYCSSSCANTEPTAIKNRKEGIIKAHEIKQKNTLEKQLTAYNDLKEALDREPKKKEWEQYCKEQSIPYRIRKSNTTTNPYALTSWEEVKEKAAVWNCRVSKVTFLDECEDVYNITVDTFHNYAVVHDPNTPHTYSGVYTINCGEQTLANKELCCLVETFPNNHESLSEYIETIKYAYLYGKTVTLVPTHDPHTNAVMMRNRRIGLSQAGITENIQRIGFREHINWCSQAYDAVQEYDKIYSEWLCIPRSIKTTTVKPGGSVPLLPGVTPGMHFPHSEYYIRRVRVSRASDIWEKYKEAGYPVEADAYEKDHTMVISFPVKEENFYKGKNEVSMWEQLELAAALQEHWSDNSVSVTITVKPEEEKDIGAALSMYESRLKSVSFLPIRGDKEYEQAPYEEITKEEYDKLVKSIKKVSSLTVEEPDRVAEKFCDGDTCTL